MSEDLSTNNLDARHPTTNNPTIDQAILKQVSTVHVAPLELEPNSTTPWRYYVRFADYHTLEAHKKAMGDISVREDAPQPEGLWSGTMTDEYREHLRRDPGVVAVWQYDGHGEWF